MNSVVTKILLEYLKGIDVVFCSEESPVLWHIWHENKKIVKLWN